jgi:rubrerythrin
MMNKKRVKVSSGKAADNKTDILRYMKLAINTEKRGIKFYSTAKKKVNDYGMSRLMDVLLEQEHKHLAAFVDIYNAEKDENEAAAERIAARYKKQAPIKNPMFGKKALHEVVMKSAVHSLFAQAIEFEQDGHDLYMDIARKIKDKRISTFLKMVANEELRHKEFIKMHQESVYNTGYWMGVDHVRLEM